MTDLIDSLSTLVPVLIGAFIAFLSTIGIDYVRDKKESSRDKKLLRASLCQLERQLAWSLLRIAPTIGKLDEELFDQLSHIVTGKRSEQMPGEDTLELEQLLKKISPGDKVAAINRLNALGGGKTLGLKKLHPQFVLVSFSRFYSLKEKCLLSVSEISAKVMLINEEIESYRFYFQQTFDPSKMKTNSTELESNMRLSIDTILLQSSQLLTLIDFTLGELET